MADRITALTTRQVDQLQAQNWRCAYACGEAILPGDELALAYDGNGIVHLQCACIGQAPSRVLSEERD